MYTSVSSIRACWLQRTVSCECRVSALDVAVVTESALHRLRIAYVHGRVFCSLVVAVKMCLSMCLFWYPSYVCAVVLHGAVCTVSSCTVIGGVSRPSEAISGELQNDEVTSLRVYAPRACIAGAMCVFGSMDTHSTRIKRRVT